MPHRDAPPSVPFRVVRPSLAKREFPDLFPQLVSALERGDQLADRAILSLSEYSGPEAHGLIARALSGSSDVPAPLLDLVRSASAVPSWLDRERVDRAGRVFFRAGLLGGISLGMRSLVYGYAAPIGNKPLAFSGALQEKAERRLAETGRFITSVCTSGGMHPGGEGFRSTIHVRLMHAKVRLLALAHPNWNERAYGLPINQHDMLATILLFSVVFLDGIRLLGVDVSEQEEEDYVHLFRWVAQVIGVEVDLLPHSAQEARRMADFIRLTQGDPDADSRALVRALLDEPLRKATSPEEIRRAKKLVRAAEGVCRALLDESTADGLGLRRNVSTHLVPGVRASFHLLGRIRRRVPGLEEWVQTLGARYWTWNIKRGLRDGGILFPLPSALSGAPAIGKLGR